MKNIPSHNSVAPSHDAVLGAGPVKFWGKKAPDGDAAPWSWAQVGSEYTYVDDGHLRIYRKASNNKRDDDWKIVQGVISQRVTLAEFTDGGAAIGTLNLANDVPAGAWVQQTVLRDVTGFAGNTSATIQVGDGTDVDRYSTGTPSVFADAVAIDVGVPSGTKVHTTAKTPKLTITAGSDWGAVTGGALTIDIYYLG